MATSTRINPTPKAEIRLSLRWYSSENPANTISGIGEITQSAVARATKGAFFFDLVKKSEASSMLTLITSLLSEITSVTSTASLSLTASSFSESHPAPPAWNQALS